MNNKLNGSAKNGDKEGNESQVDRKLLEGECLLNKKPILQAGSSNFYNNSGAVVNDHQITLNYQKGRTRCDIDTCENANNQKLWSFDNRNNSEYLQGILYETSFDSNSEDEDEHCVYTYKGSEADDCFPELSVHLNINGQNGRERDPDCSSPEMDFLEMDFDPGPYNGQDSDGEDHSPRIPTSLIQIDTHPAYRKPFDLSQNSSEINLLRESCDENANCYTVKSVTGPNYDENSKNFLNFCDKEIPCCSKSLDMCKGNEISVNECLQNGENTCSDVADDPGMFEIMEKNVHMFEISRVAECKPITKAIHEISANSDSEEKTFSSNELNNIPCDNVQTDSEKYFFTSFVTENCTEKDFINNEDLLPVDPSYCICALLNVGKILNIDLVPNDRNRLISLLQSKQIPDDIPLVEYLFMRAVQNVNETELSKFAVNVFENKLHSWFFPVPATVPFDLLEWFYFWMEKGAVPVVTRNIQEEDVLKTKNMICNPWRHNVVYKIDAPYVYLTNPSEKIEICVLHRQLSQSPLVFVDRMNILQKWNSRVDLRSLMKANHNRWYKENVLGQVVNVIRESCSGCKSTQYVRIPSNCRCGITLFVPSSNEQLCREIDAAFESSVAIPS